MKHVFTYGSLMFPEVWCHIVSQEYIAHESTIVGYERRGVVGEHYPALVAANPKAIHDEVRGRLYLNVSAKDLEALDRFEGEQYQRLTLPVKVAATPVTFLTVMSGVPVNPSARAAVPEVF